MPRRGHGRKRTRSRVGLGARRGDVDLVTVEPHRGGGEAPVVAQRRHEQGRQRHRIAHHDDVDVGPAAAEQEVADGAADEVDPVPSAAAYDLQLG